MNVNADGYVATKDANQLAFVDVTEQTIVKVRYQQHMLGDGMTQTV